METPESPDPPEPGIEPEELTRPVGPGDEQVPEEPAPETPDEEVTPDLQEVGE